MSKKVTGADLEKLIKEATGPFGDNPTFNLSTPGGKLSEPAVKKVAKIAFNLDKAETPNAKQIATIKILANKDKDPLSISGEDFKIGYDIKKYKPLINNIIGWLITNEPIATKRHLDDAGGEFKKRFNNASTGINKDDEDVFVSPGDTRVPHWLNKAKNDKGLEKKDLTSIANAARPHELITKADFVEILKDPKTFL